MRTATPCSSRSRATPPRSRWTSAARELLLALDELDPRHGRAVALALPELEDPRVAARTLGVPRPDLGEKFVDDVAVRHHLQDLPAGGDVAPLRERDQAFRERA